MMNLFRNSEIKMAALLYGIVFTAATLVASILDTRFGFLMVLVCMLFSGINLYIYYKRYEKISEFSLSINKVLHGDQQLDIEKFSEGELSILQSEINKMVVCMREQQKKLQMDKIYLSDSLADISHQIRTPLTSINLLISLISDPEITAKKRLQLSRELYDLLDRIEWLVTSLLKISKLDAKTVSFKTRRVSIDELIKKSTAPLLIPMELRNQTLKIDVKGEATVDILWTCEAITNIVKNCMEHTPVDGTIEISSLENAIYTEIIISDNGTGISPNDLPHIFDRFYKGKNSGDKSFGIGLALARMIIIAQNGTIKAENQKLSGAKFIIKFYKGII